MQHQATEILEGRRRKASRTRAKKDAEKMLVPSDIFLGYRLWRVHHLWKRQIERRLRAIGLTRTQYLLLVATLFLIAKGEAPSQIRLSNFTLVEKMKVSKTLRELEDRGYLSRKPTPGDRRANRLELTPPGEELLRRAFVISTEAHGKFFDILGYDRKGLDGILQALIDSNSV
jgi:DNA-binding MarR family transcriptional regulator